MTLAELNDLSKYLETLEDGWDSYKAKKPSKETIKKFKSLIKYLKNKKFDFDLISHSSACITWPGVGITIEKDDLEYIIEILDKRIIVTQLNNNELKSYVVLDSSILQVIEHMKVTGLFKQNKEIKNVR